MSAEKLTGHESAAELADWAGSPMSTLHPMAAADQPIDCEEHAEENRYVVRLELPALDAVRDLEVSVDAHVLTVRSERPAAAAGKEAGKDTFLSHIKLPAGTDDKDIAATYRDGILEVSAGWADDPTARKIKVLVLADAGGVTLPQ